MISDKERRRIANELREAAGIGDDKSLAQLLHYLQFQEVESRIKEAEKVVE